MKKIITYSVCLLIVMRSIVSSDASKSAADHVELTSCHVKHIESRALCATLSVPEDWSSPGGKHISLYVAVIPPSGGQATKTPLYVLAGGPGQAASTLGTNVDIGLKRARRGREVVLLDQRGTGKSTPFNCVFSLNSDVKGDEFASACLASTANQPQFYDSAAFMQDLDAVRQALGHEHINLLGGSYGTRAALLYLRDYPQHVRSIILDAVAAPETAYFEQFQASSSRALNTLFEDCATDTDCQTSYPNLLAQFEQVLQALADTPATLLLPEKIDVTPDVFLNVIRNALYSPLSTAQLPLVIDAAANGNYAPWSAVAGAMNGAYLDISMGTMLSVLCGEELDTTSPEAIQRASKDGAFAAVSMEFWFDACTVWPHKKASTGYREPVVSSVPALLLSGVQDPVTPPAFGHTAASRLNNSAHIVAPFGGHTIGSYGCVPKLIATFLNELKPAAIDASCLDGLTRESFALSVAGPKP